mmetsp:Transcript_129793/g.416476  ORF Transcript_129793/g.416476 Transcript_129793/m.416476 type:complete len:313 (+) Transcript_129793:639-1577(+)
MQEPRASDHSSVIDDDDLPGVQEVADAGVVRIRRGGADLHVVFAHDDVVLHATLVAVVEQAVLHGSAVVEGRVPEGAWHTKKPCAHRRCCTAVCSCRVVRTSAGCGCCHAPGRPLAAGERGALRKQPLPRQALRQRLLRTRPGSPVLLQGRVAVQLLRLEASSCTGCGLGAGAQAEAQARHIGGGHQACALPQPRRLGGAVTRHKQVLGQGRQARGPARRRRIPQRRRPPGAQARHRAPWHAAAARSALARLVGEHVPLQPILIEHLGQIAARSCRMQASQSIACTHARARAQSAEPNHRRRVGRRRARPIG